MTTEMHKTVVIPPRKLGEFERQFAKSLRLEQQRSLRELGKQVVLELQRNSAHIKDLGAFQKGWRAQANFTRLEVWNQEPHAIFVEAGRRAGARPPPVAAIEPWVVRHLGDPRLAFPVARNIGIRGIRARPVLNNPVVWNRVLDMAAEAVSDAWARAAEAAIK